MMTRHAATERQTGLPPPTDLEIDGERIVEIRQHRR